MPATRARVGDRGAGTIFASASDFSAGKAAVQEITLGTGGLRGGDIFGAMQVTGYAGVVESMLHG